MDLLRDIGRTALLALCAALLLSSSTAAQEPIPLDLGGAIDVSGGSYTIPIMVSPGSGGVQPNLSIAIGRGGGNGLLGWRVSLEGLSSISPVPKTMYYDGESCEVQYGGADALALDGVRLILTGKNTYSPVNDPYTEVVCSNGRFTLTAPNGAVAEYGGDAGSATFKTPQGQKPYAYALRRVTDHNGNYMEYTYEVSGSEYLIKEICYTGNGSRAPYNTVEFHYEPKDNPVNGYVVGENIARSSRIRNIDVMCEGILAKRYTMSYSTNDRLIRVDLDAEGITYAPTGIDWNPTTSLHGYGISPLTDKSLIDFDGDGILDELRLWHGFLRMGWSSADTVHSINVYRAYASLQTPQMTMPTTSITGVQLSDIDGSGSPSVLIATEVERQGTEGGTPTPYKEVHLVAYTASRAGIESRLLVAHRLEGAELGKPYDFYPVDINSDGTAEIFFVVGGSLKSISGIKTFPACENVRDVKPMNLDGDGNVDVLLVREDGSMEVWEYQGGKVNVLKRYAAGTSMAGQDVLLGDFNGDGLSDILCRKNHLEWKVIFGTGRTSHDAVERTIALACDASGARRYAIPITPTITIPDSIYLPSQHLLVHDLDGDRLSDIVYHEMNTIRVLCSSTGWATPTTIREGITQPMRGLFDIGADGVADILFEDGYLAFSGSNLWAGEVREVNNNVNETVTFSYECHRDTAVTGTTEWPLRDVRGPFLHLMSITRRCGDALSQTWSYRHSGGMEHMGGLGFLGYRHVSVSDDLTGEEVQTTYSFEVPATEGAPSRYARHEVDRVHRRNGTTISTTTTSHIKQGDGNLIFRMRPSRVVSSNKLTGVSTTTCYKYHGASGMPTTITATTEGWTTTTAIAYSSISGLHRPTTMMTTTVHQGETHVHTTSYTYTPDNPLRVSTVTEQGVTTAYGGFDPYGNPTTTSCDGRTMSMTYDSRGRFVLSTTDAAGITTSYTYRSTDGLRTSTTDANGLTSTMALTASAGALIATMSYPDATTATVEVGLSGMGSAKFYRKQVSPSGAVHVDHLDAAGRVIAADRYGLDGAVHTTSYAYTERGELRSVTRPGATAPTEYSYHDDGRLKSVRGHNGQNEDYTYDGLTTECRRVGIEGGITMTTHDAMGNVVLVEAPTGDVAYTYWPNGRVKSMTALGATSTYQYDTRGNLVQSNEVDRGVRTYTYNTFNQVLTERDAMGHVTTSHYDGAGRLVQRSAPDYTETYQYGTADGTRGLLVLSTRGEVQQTYAYDQYSRRVGTTTLVGSHTYKSSCTYNGQGLPDAVTHPTGVQLVYTYDAYGNLKSIGRSPNGAPLWSGEEQDERGRWTSYTLGNGLRGHLEYGGTNQQLSSITVGTTHDPSSLLDLTYRYDVNGLLISRSDRKMGLVEMFGYDAMERLTAATAEGRQDQLTTYDDNGNIKSSPAGTYGYSHPTFPHALTGINGVTASRDLPMLTTETTYSTDLQLTSADNGGYRVDFALYPGGTRAKATYTRSGLPNGYKVYVDGCELLYSADGVLTGQRTMVHAPAGVVVVLEGDGDTAAPTYVHTDNQGSWVALSDASGGLLSRQSFDAWGRPRDPSTWEVLEVGDSPAACLAAMQPMFDRGYTGHEHLLGLGLIHMNGRAYDPYTQRFLSPDPVLLLPANAQNHNRYSYCLNNPLRYTDPSGYRFSFMESFNTLLDDTFLGLMFNNCLGDYLYDEDGGGGSGVGAPGSQGNGTGLNGVYYDWLSHTYRSTTSGNQVSWDFVQGVIAPYTISISDYIDANGGVVAYRTTMDSDGAHILDANGDHVVFIISCLNIYFELPIDTDNCTSAEGDGGWTKNAQTFIGALGAVNGVKLELINYATKADPALNCMKYIKAVRIFGGIAFGASTVISAGLATNYYMNGGIDYSVAIKSGIDIAMGVVGFLGPIGFGISTTYFIIDVASDGFGGYEDPLKINK